MASFLNSFSPFINVNELRFHVLSKEKWPWKERYRTLNQYSQSRKAYKLSKIDRFAAKCETLSFLFIIQVIEYCGTQKSSLRLFFRHCETKSFPPKIIKNDFFLLNLLGRKARCLKISKVFPWFTKSFTGDANLDRCRPVLLMTDLSLLNEISTKKLDWK